MLDTARNYFPVEDIKRTLDAMSWVKINTFHWHVVDSQSFPLVVPGYTELSAKGAYSSAEVYTPGDVKEIVAYAAAVCLNLIVLDSNSKDTKTILSSAVLTSCQKLIPQATLLSSQKLTLSISHALRLHLGRHSQMVNTDFTSLSI